MYTKLLLIAIKAVVSKFTKAIKIIKISKRFAIGCSNNENTYGPLVKVVFNWASPNPINKPNN